MDGTAVLEQPTAELATLEPVALIELLGDPDVLRDVLAELERRLPQNRVNFCFFVLVEAFRRKSNALAKYGYENLHQMAMRYLTDFHRPTYQVAWTGEAPLSEWDNIFHKTLFGDGLREKGELSRYLKLSPEQNWENALLNRYSGLLTRCGQRHKDTWRQELFHAGGHCYVTQTPTGNKLEWVSKNTEEEQEEEALENDIAPDIDDFREYIDSGNVLDVTWGSLGYDESTNEDVIGLESGGGLIKDGITFADMIHDPQNGSRPDETEQIFDRHIATMEWTAANRNEIWREAGQTAMWTWQIIAEAMTEGDMQDIDHLSLPGVRKSLLDVICGAEGIGRKAAEKRLRQLKKSETLRGYLYGSALLGDRFLSPLPRMIRVGKSQRKKAGSDGFRVSDRQTRTCGVTQGPE